MLLAAGQPIFTDDLWWHLGLGRTFAAQGPWLPEDPLLFMGLGSPPTSAWLWQVALAKLLAVAGFDGLRVLHVGWVAAILGLLWSLLRRASASPAFASLGTLVFVALSAYRLVQFRPHLFTMLALFAVYWLLLEKASPPGPARIAAAVGLAGLWANLHAAFPLGLALVAVALVAAWVRMWDRSPASAHGLRAKRLALALAGMLLATLANPAGPGAYAAYFVAGDTSPPLGIVYDEWRGAGLLGWPRSFLNPSPLAWLLLWGIWLGFIALAGMELRSRWRRGTWRLDPALLATGAFGLVLQTSAVRFLWLGALPLLGFAHGFRLHRGSRLARPSWGLAGFAASIALLLAFVRVGDWPMVSRQLPRSIEGYERSYATDKYFAEAIWFLRDAGLRGRLYTDYSLGGFAGYWLAPRVRTLVNGSLSFPREVAGALRAIRERRGQQPGESFEALLDRLGVDLFLGIRVPQEGNPVRPWASTLAHLEGVPGWIPIFRSLGSALYLRASPENAAALAGAAAYYRARGVPFDAERGLEVDAAIRQAPGWSVRNSLVPRDWARLQHRVLHGGGAASVAERDRLAALYSVLGLYEAAVELDRSALAAGAAGPRSRRRLVWALARLGRLKEASAEARLLEAQPEQDPLEARLRAAVLALPALGADRAAASRARLPWLRRSEVRWLYSGVLPAPVRAPREDTAR